MNDNLSNLKNKLMASLEKAVEKLDTVSATFVTLLKHGSMSVEYYQPDQIDHQSPHEQDELYVIISGTGEFELEGKTTTFQAQDVLFVPAGKQHRFVNFSADFRTWVIFYGATGGETTAITTLSWQKGAYELHDNQQNFDVPYIHQFLSNSYWAKGRSLETVQQSMENSHCFGLFDRTKQIGFARVITDYSTFAYLADVFVDENYRGQGLGKWLTKQVVNASLFKTCKWLLKTLDAQSMYQQLGFHPAKASPEIMEK